MENMNANCIYWITHIFASLLQNIYWVRRKLFDLFYIWTKKGNDIILWNACNSIFEIFANLIFIVSHKPMPQIKGMSQQKLNDSEL